MEPAVSTVFQKPVFVLVLMCLVPLTVASQQSVARRPGEGSGQSKQPSNKESFPGWVVVQRGTSGDDTQAIQAAIDQVAESGGGCVLLPTGIWRHTGLTGRAGVHLRGTRSNATVLEFTLKTGDGITLEADPNFFAISEVRLESTARSTGWAIRADKGTQRSVRIESVNTNGFHNGVLIANALNVTIENCRIGHTFPNNPTGIGIQVGDGRRMGGNGVTISDCYLNSLEKGIVTYAQACLISRPCLELCRVGIENHGTTTVLMPWVDSTTDQAHVSVQPNTVGGGRSGTGTLMLGYGSSGWNMKYGSPDERDRTLIVPERLDFPPGDDADNPRGVKLGNVVIDRDGVVHAKDFRKLPEPLSN